MVINRRPSSYVSFAVSSVPGEILNPGVLTFRFLPDWRGMEDWVK
jgi:hypothetical protein